MKQHITTEQLKELSKKGLKKYQKYLNSLEYVDVYKYLYMGRAGKRIDFTKEETDTLPVLSIGQMIEFLDEEDDYFKTWYRQGKSKISKECRTFEWLYDTELCNALWEAVKEVLNEKI